jgi:hypothetical protein
LDLGTEEQCKEHDFEPVDLLASVRNIEYILIPRINILIMTNSSDLVIILYVHVFKFNLLLNENTIQNMNQRSLEAMPDALDAPSPTRVDILLGWSCLK